MDRGPRRRRRRKGNRGRLSNTPEWDGAPLNPLQCPPGPPTTTTTTTTTTTIGTISDSTTASLDQPHDQPTPPSAGPLQPINRFCLPQGSQKASAAPSAHPFMENFMAQVLQLLKDVSPMERDQLFWGVYTQMADYFGQPYLPRRCPPNYRSQTRLSPSPWNQVTLYRSSEINRYERDFEEVMVLGDGGFGHVVKARNKIDGCFYAIKIIVLDQSDVSPDESLLEVHTLARLYHPNIVRYHQAWFQYDLRPWSSIGTASRGSLSDSEDESEAESIKLTPSSRSNGFNGLAPPLSCHQEARISTEDNIQFLSSGKGQQHLLKPQGAEGGAASNAVLPYFRFHPVPLPKKKLYIQMGLCRESLKQWLDGRNMSAQPVPHNRCLEILEELLKALSYIHAQGIIHRDVKPANIFFTEEGHIQLGDFGLAKQNIQPPTSLSGTSNLVPITTQRNTARVGTRLYTAPEVDDGNYGAKSDMFSVGITLLELLSSFTTTHERIDTIQSLKNKRVLDQELKLRWPEMADLILELTHPEPARRPSSEELLKSSLFDQPFPPPLPPPLPLIAAAAAAAATPMPVSPDRGLINGVLMLDESIAGVGGLHSEIKGIESIKLNSVKSYEMSKFNCIQSESLSVVNTLERRVSTEEENAVLREENFMLKKQVAELQHKLQSLEVNESAPSTLNN